MIDPTTFFSRCDVINLDDDTDRLAEFKARTAPDRWPFVQPERWRAVAGKRAPHPDWWRGGGGAWGCFRSHLQIIEHCLVENVPSVLILEDDAVPCDDFARRVKPFLEAVPNDWGMIYLGGQHLMAGSHPPRRVNAEVFRPYNVNRTHAFALSRDGMKAVYKHLCRQDWNAAQHIDHHLGRLHMSGSLPIYCPNEWLIGQAAGTSRISGRTTDLRFWKHAKEFATGGQSPFVANVGLHSSGSSAVAGVCWHLGTHLGNTLAGYYEVDPKHPAQRGFEAQGLARICERAARFPSTEIHNPQTLHKDLGRWIGERQREANSRKTIAGGKYPHLCRMGEQLQAICGEGLHLIHCDRPLEESIESLKRRVQQGSPKCSPIEAERVQRWLYEGKRQFLMDVPAERQISIEYDALLENPEREVLKLSEFLHITPKPEQINAAVNLIRPERRHIQLAH